MERQISLKNVFYPKTIKDGLLPYELMVEVLKDEPGLIEKEDYFFVGNDCYIKLKAALFLLGRFSITDIYDIVEDITNLAQPDKKSFSGLNDSRLPQLNSYEQDWNDQILPIIKENAKCLEIDFKSMLAKIYKEMNINFPYYIGEYLNRIGVPNATHVTKFRVVTCTKELRIEFENAMSRIMSMYSYRELV